MPCRASPPRAKIGPTFFRTETCKAGSGARGGASCRADGGADDGIGGGAGGGAVGDGAGIAAGTGTSNDASNGAEDNVGGQEGVNACSPEAATVGTGAFRPAVVPTVVATGVSAASTAAGTLESAGGANGGDGAESVCHTASVEQHPSRYTGGERGGVPGLTRVAIPPASPPRFLQPRAGRSGVAEHGFMR